MTDIAQWIKSARESWAWRGQARPPNAIKPAEGEISVWDFPRPPAIVADTREIVITWDNLEIARTTRAVAVLETSHPPTFYLPWDDIASEWMVEGRGNSFCEWKGPAQYWSLVHEDKKLTNVAWRYPSPLAGAEALLNCVAFYAHNLRCTVGGATVTPQPGGFYGGWVTPELVGPFKGDAGSTGW
jgi:uncharacterized protein (DUF427 family)